MSTNELELDDTVTLRIPRIVKARLEDEGYAHKVKGAGPFLRLLALERYGIPLPDGIQVREPTNPEAA